MSPRRFLCITSVACFLLPLVSAEAQRAIVTIAGISGPIRMDTVGQYVDVNATHARVFHAAVLALEGLRIPLEARDSVAGNIGNLRFTQSRRLGGTNLGQYFNCGNTMTGARADSYRLTMPLLVMLDRLPENRTRLRVAVVASARDMSGPSTEPVACHTTGLLEGRILRAIEQHLAASPP